MAKESTRVQVCWERDRATKLVPGSLYRLIADEWVEDGRCVDVRNVCTTFGMNWTTNALTMLHCHIGPHDQSKPNSWFAGSAEQKCPQCITTSSPLVLALPKGALNGVLTARNQKFWNYSELQGETAKWSTSQGGPLPDPLLYSLFVTMFPRIKFIIYLSVCLWRRFIVYVV
jgi:hypothetical protein